MSEGLIAILLLWLIVSIVIVFIMFSEDELESYFDSLKKAIRLIDPVIIILLLPGLVLALIIYIIYFLVVKASETIIYRR